MDKYLTKRNVIIAAVLVIAYVLWKRAAAKRAQAAAAQVVPQTNNILQTIGETVGFPLPMVGPQNSDPGTLRWNIS